jgi:hypothetical protein
MTKLSALAIILTGLLIGRQAHADIYYTVTTTGTIVSGYDAGTFGGVGNLAGYSFAVLEVFDATTGSFASVPGVQQLNPAPGAALLSVNNQNYVINGSPGDDLLFLTDALHQFGDNGVNQDEIFSQIEDSAGDFFASGVASTSLDFLSSDNLAQDVSYTLPGSGTVSFGESLSAQEVFIGSVSSVTLTVVPEPATAALFSMSLAVLGWIRRRAAKRRSQAPTDRARSPA